MEFVDNFIQKHPLKEISLHGKKFKYLVGGRATTAYVVLPGSGQDLYSCFDLVDYFEERYKVIVVSFSGFYTLEKYFEYLNAVLEQEKVEKVILYGYSMGGFLAQHYIKSFPENVSHIIVSHTASINSKHFIRHVVIPGKILHFILPVFPLTLFRTLLQKNAGKVQSGTSNVTDLYNRYSTKENHQRRSSMFRILGWGWLTKDYLESLYYLGIEMEKEEKSKFKFNVLKGWKGKMLIIRTDNDPLAQDEGIFKTYYPQATVITFSKTGHLTPIIQFNNMASEIDRFLKKS